jgi:hypothetical protein
VSVRGRSAAVADVPGRGQGPARLHVLTPALPGQVLAPGSLTTVRGAGRGNVQGWLSPRMGRKVAAPVIVAARGQRTAAFLTVLVPGAPGSKAAAVTRVVDGRTFVDVVVDGVTTTYRVGRTTISR